MNTFDLALDLDKRAGVTQWVTLRQGDHNGTVLKATIYDHGVQVGGGYTCRVSIRIAGSGDEYYRETANYSNGVATVTIDEQYAAAVVGITYGYFELLQGSAVIASTEDFGVRVLQSAQEGAVPGDKYDSAIEDALAELDEATGRISQMVVDATEEYLEAHPEITTTVQDNSLTDAKLIQKGGILQREQWLETMLPNIPRKTTSEADVHSVTDSAGGGPLGIEVYGRSTQDGTPTLDAPVAIQSVTPNLAKGYEATVTNNGITYVTTEGGATTISGTASSGSAMPLQTAGTFALPAGTYTLVVGGELTAASGSGARAQLVKVTGSSISNVAATPFMTGGGTTYVTFTTTEDMTAFVRIGVNIGSVSGTLQFALYEGSLAYLPAPYDCVKLLAAGRNLLALSPHSLTLANVEITVTDESITYNGTANSTGGGRTHALSEYTILPAGTYRLSVASLPVNLTVFVERLSDSAILAGTDRSLTFTLSEPTSVYVGINMVPSATFSNAVVSGIQIEFGSVAHAYKPYVTPVTIPIPLGGRSLRSLPDGTRDEVNVDEWGHARLIQRVGETTFDGTEGWTMANNAGIQLTYSSPNAKWSDALSATNLTNIWCNRATPSNSMTAVGRCKLDSRYPNLTFPLDTFSTVADLKAWLADNPTTMYYPLATPQTIDLGYLDPALLPAPDLTAYVVPSAPSVLRYGFDVAAAIAEIATA